MSNTNGTRANRPAPSSANDGNTYTTTDTDVRYLSNGVDWLEQDDILVARLVALAALVNATDTTNGQINTLADGRITAALAPAAGQVPAGAIKAAITEAVGAVELTPGAPGSQWFRGSGTPSNTDGIAGDNYLDFSTGNIWVKGASTWTNTGLSIKGPQGNAGTAGATPTQSLAAFVASLPTVDPVSAGTLWNDTGVIKVSAGA